MLVKYLIIFRSCLGLFAKKLRNVTLSLVMSVLFYARRIILFLVSRLESLLKFVDITDYG
jgi:hypothetical protein